MHARTLEGFENQLERVHNLSKLEFFKVPTELPHVNLIQSFRIFKIIYTIKIECVLRIILKHRSD